MHAKTSYLTITNHSEVQHETSVYRFRYGAPTNEEIDKNPPPVTIKRGSYRVVWSMEGFEVSERVLGIFGHSSDLFLRGLELIHSPFIDPKFRGHLQLTVRNFSEKDVILKTGDEIGKITFFDISDSILSAADLLKDIQENTHNRLREKAMEVVGGALKEIALSKTE
jgi:deoxycytidine triphosphate deaminase